MEKDLYQKLIERKSNGEKLEWNNITKEELEELFSSYPDSMIAELYNITKSQVTKKRKDWNITQLDCTLNKLFNV